MTEHASDRTVDERLETLERVVSSITTTTNLTPVETKMGGLFCFLAFVAYVLIIANLPLPGRSSGGMRVVVGVLSGIGGVVVFFAAGVCVKFSLRALALIVLFIMLLLNASVVAVAWSSSAYLTQLLSSVNVVPVKDVQTAMFVIVAAMFVVDVAVWIVLYPLMKIAGLNDNP